MRSFVNDIISTLVGNEDILGVNERNLTYIRPNNKTKARRIADNKLLTKKILTRKGIPNPRMIAQIRSVQELEDFDWKKLPKSFALKPKNGYEGRGILVVSGKSNRTGRWIKTDGKRIELDEIKERVLRILEGEFSLRNEIDTAFFEEKIITHKSLTQYTYKGVPDVRVIVYNKVPVMAELRLPTKASDGKANLHRGGIIVGIDMASGTTTTAVQYNNIIEKHPDNGKILSGIKIPYWDRVLELSVKCQFETGIGFLGADIVIDANHGPLVMELNARPGLGIQIANQDGLKGRLKRIKGLKIKTIERGVNVAKSLFGGDIEESIEEISGKQMVAIKEDAQFYKIDDPSTFIDVRVKNDTGAYSTSIGYDLAEKLGYQESLYFFNSLDFNKKALTYEYAKEIKRKYKDQVFIEAPLIQKIALVRSGNGISIRPVVPIKFRMSGTIIETRATIEDREGLRFNAIIGRKDLRKFLIDASKK